MEYGTLIHFGGAAKVLKADGDMVTIGGPGVVFDDPSSPTKDLVGDFFTKDTYFGAHKGDGVDVLFHHGMPVSNVKFAKGLSDYLFPPVKVVEEEGALVASVILNMRKEYEAFVAEQAQKGLLSWSSGAVGHMVRREKSGWLRTWPIGEWSLTPTPAEPRTSAVPLKSFAPDIGDPEWYHDAWLDLSRRYKLHNLSLDIMLRT